MKKILVLLLVSLSIYGCEKQQETTTPTSDEKIEVTLQRVGEIHNYLLNKVHTSPSPQLLLLNNKEDATMGDYFQIFKEELQNDEKYYYDEDLLTRSSKKYADFYDDFMEIKADKYFFEKSRELLFEKLENDENTSKEIIELLRKASDIRNSHMSEELSMAISRSTPSEGGDLLFAFNEIDKASSAYWDDFHSGTRGAPEREVIVADCIGGVLGAACGGVMSVIWGAAFSYSYDMCIEQ